MAAMLLMQYASMAGTAGGIFWAAAALLFYVYLGYPLLLAAIALFVRKPRRNRDIARASPC